METEVIITVRRADASGADWTMQEEVIMERTNIQDEQDCMDMSRELYWSLREALKL